MIWHDVQFTNQTLCHISNKRRDSESAAGNQTMRSNSIMAIIRVSVIVRADAIALLLGGLLLRLPFVAQT
jgi:hypothetical protein